MSLNLNAALSSFITASPRLIHHSKTLHWKKKKKTLPLTCLATKTLSVCEPNILIVVVVARAGLFTVRQIREWATYVFIYLFIFTLRYVIAPFRYLSRPLISTALAPALQQRIAESEIAWFRRTQSQLLNKQVYFMPSLCVRVNPGNLLARRTSESINL